MNRSFYLEVLTLNETLNSVLTAMGYRLLPTQNSLWAKPLGCSLLVYRPSFNGEPPRLEINSVNKHGKPMTWDSENLPSTDDLDAFRLALITAECHICNNGVHYQQFIKRLDFLTTGQALEHFSQL